VNIRLKLIIHQEGWFGRLANIIHHVRKREKKTAIDSNIHYRLKYINTTLGFLLCHLNCGRHMVSINDASSDKKRTHIGMCDICSYY